MSIQATKSTIALVTLPDIPQLTSISLEEITIVGYKLSKLVMDYAWLYYYRRVNTEGRKFLNVEDIVSQGFKVMFEEGKVTIWTLLACRILLDIHDILDPDIERGYEEVLQLASSIKTQLDIKEGNNNVASVRDGWGWTVPSDKVAFRAYRSVKTWTTLNPFAEFKERVRRRLFEEQCVTQQDLEDESNGRIV